jgi:hypothetical protein
MNLNIPRKYTQNLNIPKEFTPPHNLLSLKVKDIQSAALRKATFNLLGATVLVYYMYTFFMSPDYIRFLSHEGQIKILQRFSGLLLYVLQITEVIAKMVPQLFNTINTVVPVYSQALIKNFLMNPVNTITTFHKKAGLTKMNIPAMAMALSYGGMSNLLTPSGGVAGLVVSSITSIPTLGLRQFLKYSQGMSTEQLTRYYLTATVVGGMGQLRSYMEGVTRQVIRMGMVAAISAMGTAMTEVGRSAIVYKRAPKMVLNSQKSREINST